MTHPPVVRLSKSKVIAGRQCPRRLWLQIHKKEAAGDVGNHAHLGLIKANRDWLAEEIV